MERDESTYTPGVGINRPINRHIVVTVDTNAEGNITNDGTSRQSNGLAQLAKDAPVSVVSWIDIPLRSVSKSFFHQP
jgi:hypothetical protein